MLSGAKHRQSLVEPYKGRSFAALRMTAPVDFLHSLLDLHTRRGANLQSGRAIPQGIAAEPQTTDGVLSVWKPQSFALRQPGQFRGCTPKHRRGG